MGTRFIHILPRKYLRKSKEERKNIHSCFMLIVDTGWMEGEDSMMLICYGVFVYIIMKEHCVVYNHNLFTKENYRLVNIRKARARACVCVCVSHFINVLYIIL